MFGIPVLEYYYNVKSFLIFELKLKANITIHAGGGAVSHLNDAMRSCRICGTNPSKSSTMISTGGQVAKDGMVWVQGHLVSCWCIL